MTADTQPMPPSDMQILMSGYRIATPEYSQSTDDVKDEAAKRAPTTPGGGVGRRAHRLPGRAHVEADDGFGFGTGFEERFPVPAVDGRESELVWGLGEG